MSTERIMTGAILLASLVCLFLVLPQQVETVSYGRIVPSTLPTALLWIMAVAATIQLITLKDGVRIHGQVVFRAALVLTLMIVSIWMMDTVAFEYIAPILALLLMLFIGEKRWYWLLTGSMVIPLGIWLLVEQVLHRSLA